MTFSVNRDSCGCLDNTWNSWNMIFLPWLLVWGSFRVQSTLWFPHGFLWSSGHLAPVTQPRLETVASLCLSSKKNWFVRCSQSSKRHVQLCSLFLFRNDIVLYYFLMWHTTSFWRQLKKFGMMHHLKMSLASFDDRLEDQHSFRWVLLHLSKIHFHSY